MINPLFLRTFISLVNTKHFTHTAQQLNMTQPGVSQHIKKLEAQLGQQLLNRYGKQFELTTAGETLYRFGLKQVEAEAELLKSITTDNKHVGECFLACSGSMAMQIFPELLKLQKKFPNLSMNVEAAPNPRIVERVKENLSEIGLVTQFLDDPKLEQTHIGSDELCLVVPSGACYSWENLKQLGFINHPDGYHYASQLLAANFPDEFQGIEEFKQSAYVNQLGQILLPVSLGLGFTVIQKSSVDVFSNAEKVSIVELTVPLIEKVYLTTKKHRKLPSRYELVIDVIRKQLD